MGRPRIPRDVAAEPYCRVSRAALQRLVDLADDQIQNMGYDNPAVRRAVRTAKGALLR